LILEQVILGCFFGLGFEVFAGCVELCRVFGEGLDFRLPLTKKFSWQKIVFLWMINIDVAYVKVNKVPELKKGDRSQSEITAR
jgi:hypothetical protein